MAYVNPLGYYELYINGRKVDDHVFSPAVSDYSKRNLYVTHEVADYLVPGKNVVALWLGRGWYVRGHPGVVHDGPLVRAPTGDLHAVTAARPESSPTTPGSSAPAPITPLGRGTAFGDYGGERYDAGLELADWNSVNLDDSGWQTAAVFEPPRRADLGADGGTEPVDGDDQGAARRKPYPPGGWVIDMGKDLHGVARDQAARRFPRDTIVKLEYSDQMSAGQACAGGRRGSGRPRPGAPSTPPPGGAPTQPGGTGAQAGAAPGQGAPPRPVERPHGQGAPARRRGTARARRTAWRRSRSRWTRREPRRSFPYTFNQRDEIVGNGGPLTFRSRFNYHAFRYVRVIGLEAAPARLGRHRLSDSHRLRPGRRVRLVERSAQPDLPADHPDRTSR